MVKMTEEEWLASNNPYTMLRQCRRIIRYYHPRKGHLFAVACCHRILHLLTDQRSRAAVEVAAQYAEGLVSKEQLQAAANAAKAAHADAFREKGKVGACAEWAAQFAASADAWFAATRASNFAYVAAGDGLQPGPEHSAQAQLLRCVFGPLPFRPVTIQPDVPAWNDGLVVRLAQAIYDERRWAEMPILADALLEACSDDEELIAHCRGDGPHVRGCYAIDQILGKS